MEHQIHKNQITVFRCIRENDESGVSGTGVVLEGVRWKDGTVHVRWDTTDSSLGIYSSWAVFWKVHIASHPTNNTRVQVRGSWKEVEDHENGGQYEWHNVEEL